MRRHLLSFVRRAISDQGGQMLYPIALFGMTAFLGMAGLTIDVGHAYAVRAQLQNTANAAALAAAGSVYSGNAAAQAAGDLYSGQAPGDKNYNATLGAITTTVTPVCLNILEPAGETCVQGTSPNNAVKVVNYTTIKTPFMALLGVPTLRVGAKATAAPKGVSKPWNIAIIIDSTGSMASVDGDCGGLTEFQCALSGVQVLLKNVNPCPTGLSSCSGSTANVNVSLFTFPNVLTAVNGSLPVVNGTTYDSIANDINCNGSPATWQNYQNQPLAAPYTLPIPGKTLPVYGGSGYASAPSSYMNGLTYMRYTQAGTGTTWDATYQITPFVSDYYLPSNSSGLNPSSNLVKAVGYGNTSGCLTYTFGIWGTGSGSGFGNTYFASAIYEAYAALKAEQAGNGGQNALIYLSDGQANASDFSDNFNQSAYGTVNSSNQFSGANQFPDGAVVGQKIGTITYTYGSEVGPHVSNDPVPAYYTPATTSSTYGYDTLSSVTTGTNRSSTVKGTYPDWYDQCQQGIVAGQYATNNSTTVFSVAYGSEDSGCNSGWSVGLTDTTLVATGANQSFSLSSLTPCVTMENIASSLNNFYSDYNQSGSGSTCQDSSHPNVVSIADIFQAITATFTGAELLPNNAT